MRGDQAESASKHRFDNLPHRLGVAHDRMTAFAWTISATVTPQEQA
jgi:hypothetical protein